MIITLNEHFKNSNGIDWESIEENRIVGRRSYSNFMQYLGLEYSSRVNDMTDLFYPNETLKKTTSVAILEKRFKDLVLFSIYLSIRTTTQNRSEDYINHNPRVLRRILADTLKSGFMGFENFEVSHVVFDPFFHYAFSKYYDQKNYSIERLSEYNDRDVYDVGIRSANHLCVRLVSSTDSQNNIESFGVYCVNCKILNKMFYVFINVIGRQVYEHRSKIYSPLVLKYTAQRFTEFCKKYYKALEICPELKGNNYNLDFGTYKEI